MKLKTLKGNFWIGSMAALKLAIILPILITKCCYAQLANSTLWNFEQQKQYFIVRVNVLPENGNGSWNWNVTGSPIMRTTTEPQQPDISPYLLYIGKNHLIMSWISCFLFFSTEIQSGFRCRSFSDLNVDPLVDVGADQFRSDIQNRLRTMIKEALDIAIKQRTLNLGERYALLPANSTGQIDLEVLVQKCGKYKKQLQGFMDSKWIQNEF